MRLPPPPSAIVTAILLSFVALPACGDDDPSPSADGGTGASPSVGGGGGSGGAPIGGAPGVGGSAGSGGGGGVAGTAGVAGAGGMGPTDCSGSPPLPGLNPVYRSWESVYTNPFGSPGVRLPFPGVPLASTVNGSTVSIDMLVMQIDVPATGTAYDYGSVNQNLDNGQPLMFFSKCPGDLSWSATQTNCAINGIGLDWKIGGTHPTSQRCELALGETYYLNIVFIDGQAAKQGTVVDICAPPGTPGNYSLICYYWGTHQWA